MKTKRLHLDSYLFFLFLIFSISITAQNPFTQGLQFGGGTADTKIFHFVKLDGNKLYAENAEFDLSTMQFTYGYDYGSYRIRTPMLKTPSGQLFHLANNSSAQDIFLINVNANGSVNWSKQISNGGYNRYYHFAPKFSDTLTIVGWHSAGGDKPMVIHTDLNGNVLINKMFNYGSDDQLAVNSIGDKGGSTTICSWDFHEGFYLTNISVGGGVNWCRVFNPINGGGLVVAPRYFRKTPDGGYVVLCYRRQHGTNAGDEALVVKIDNSLAVDWVTTISFPGVSDMGIYHRLDLNMSDDDIYFQTIGTKLVGSSNSSVYIKLNSGGNVVWAKTPTDNSNNIIPRSTFLLRNKDKLCITGTLGSASTMGQNDAYIIVTDTSFSACHVDVPYQVRQESWAVAPFVPTVSDVNFTAINMTVPSTPVNFATTAPYCSGLVNLELLSFTAKAINETDAQLDWESVNEEDITHFNIQRSVNGQEWTTIATVNARGGTQANQYNYLDKEVYLPGIGKALFYYRLQSEELSGELDYSNVRTVVFNSPEEEGTVVIQPNPTVGSFQFILYKSLGAIQGTTYEVVDVAGRILRSGTVTSFKTTVDVTGVAAGMYFLRFSKNGIQNFRPQKIVVNH